MKRRTDEDRHPHYGSKTRLTIMSLSTLVGIVLLFLGFYTPPVGNIHPSVLIAFGEIATFVSFIMWIDYYYTFKDTDNFDEEE